MKSIEQLLLFKISSNFWNKYKAMKCPHTSECIIG